MSFSAFFAASARNKKSRKLILTPILQIHIIRSQ